MPRIRTLLIALVLPFFCQASQSSFSIAAGPKTPAGGLAAATESHTEACIQSGPRTPPPPELPYDSIDELCQADFGEPWVGALPVPPEPSINDDYALKIQSFLRELSYRKPVSDGGLGWIGDARWRLTGEFQGCPAPVDGKPCTSAGTCKYLGTHPLVRIYYSPEVMEFLCKYRREKSNVPPPTPENLLDGAVIVKEMYSTYQDLKLIEGTNKLWVDGNYDDTFQSWTVMVKGNKGSFDGWVWASFSKNPPQTGNEYNPPIVTRSALATEYDPVTEYPMGVPPPEGPWYPTFWNYTIPDTVYPDSSFGNYCSYCHGSAVSQSTFSSLDNIIGKEIEYEYLGPIEETHHKAPLVSEHNRSVDEPASQPLTPLTPANPRAPFPPYDPVNLATFNQTYGQFADLTYLDVWKNRFPAQTWDHAVAGPDGPDQFITSDQCMSCHDASGLGQRLPNMVVVKDDKTQVDVSPYAEWSASPMGLAGRDPVFFAMLESEVNRALKEPELKKYVDCIQNTCLHCHGNMGQRQFAIDTPGDDPCADFEPHTDPTSGGTWTPAQRRKAGYGGAPFLRNYVKEWRDQNQGHEKYAGLARDGISCTTCHHISDNDLGQSGKTFTGNFRVGAPDEIYGPFSEDIQTQPMENVLGITPEFAEQTTSSELCGSCHAIYLPVFNNEGVLLRSGFEQTTYLEWLNSVFNPDNPELPGEWRTCQQCHMRDEFVYFSPPGHERTVSLDHTRIANVQDNTFPESDFALDLDLQYRDYKRHTLYGLNVFLNAYFQQFPLLLGKMQLNYMNAVVVNPFLTGLEEVLQIARYATATVAISNIQEDATGISADVTVANLGGHKLPSGVGFRRAFLEFVVLDENNNPLWASGLTNSVGLIQDGRSSKSLSTEFLQSDPGSACNDDGWKVQGDQAWQPHYETISKECQTQIYEELVQDSDKVFTTSFIHRVEEIKDNRLLPRGYRTIPEETKPEHQPSYCRPWCAEANPKGKAKIDPLYNSTQPVGVTGTDQITYRIQLSSADLAKAKSVRATLYSQSTAPYFLNQRFNDGVEGPNREDSQRLYFLNAHLNTNAVDQNGQKYIDQYKLKIFEAKADLP